MEEKHCIPCMKGMAPLQGEKLESLYKALKGWELVEGARLEKTYTFSNFAKGLAFTNRVGEIAEREHHHPDIHLSWGKVTITLWTHKIGGLSENDFIVAGWIDQIQ
jgi:4a-hydroxytetrahydrobiopterin dehydratase